MNKRTITNLLVITLCLVSTMLVSRSGSARIATDARLKQHQAKLAESDAQKKSDDATEKLAAATNQVQQVASKKETSVETKKDAAEKALALNPDSAEGHTSLANYKSWYQHDWAGADKEFRRAIELNPNYAFAHDQFALTLACQGRFEESVVEGQRAAELDPLNPAIAIDNTLAFAGQGKFEKARNEARRGLELDPTFFFPQMQFGWFDLQEGNARAAIPDLEKANAMEAPPFVAAYLGYAYAAAGEKAKALGMIEEIKKKGVGNFVPPYNLAIVYLGLGDHVRALDYLEQAQATDSQWMMYLRMDRIFNPLRAEPRFIALMKKCHFQP